MYDLVFENDLLRCELDTQIPVLKHRWLKKPESEEFKDGLMNIRDRYIELKKEYSDLKWLADTELLGELTYDDEVWLEDIWEKRLFEEAGVQVHAVILGSDIYADYSMEKFKFSADRKLRSQGVRLNVFMDEESAIQWLKDN